MADTPATNPNRLIEAYRCYSHAISAEVLRKLPPSVDRDDVIGAAELGLVEAARSFDPARGVLFKTFAYYRIRGAIYDALRKSGWLKGDPRLRLEAGANEYLKDYTEAGTGSATAPASAYQELEQMSAVVVTSYMLSLDGAKMEIPDPAAVSAEETLLQRDARQRVRDAMARLPENNRRLIEEYYFGEATLEEIGRMLGLSKSWVCRLHARSLEMLRALLDPASRSNFAAIPGDNNTGYGTDLAKGGRRKRGGAAGAVRGAENQAVEIRPPEGRSRTASSESDGD